MIDTEIFSRAMGELADRFNRPLAPLTSRKYYATLNAELTTEEFVAAADIAFRDCTFWPSPKELIEFVKPTPDLDLEAGRAFEQLRRLGETHPTAGMCWRRADVEDLLGEAGVAAFDAIGANERLRGLTAQDLPWARREFIAAYKAAATDRGRIERAHHALVGAQRTHELSPPARAPRIPAGSGT